jgi:hypothetical protein
MTGRYCPKTGRSASACDTTDHSNCPDLATTRRIVINESYTNGFGFPLSCPVCGDDDDLHEWIEVNDLGQPVNCDRRTRH